MCFSIPLGLKTFYFMKEFKTIEEQIELLKSRGLNFRYEFQARFLLSDYNYYNVINGYKELFIKPGTKDEYLFDATFEEIFALYEFDKKLKDLLLKYILKLEGILRTRISYTFSKYHGNDNYLKLESFDNYNKNTTVNPNILQKRLQNICNIIGIINKEIGKAIDTKPYINHYLIEYGFIPFWVLVNILTFGMLSKFFELMKQNERIEVAKTFGLKENELVIYVKYLAYFRNLCAHDERIYNAKVPKYLYIPNNQIHDKMKIPKEGTMYVYGKNDLFALFIVLSEMLPSPHFFYFLDEFSECLKVLDANLQVITIEDILSIMNFPINWEQIK